MWIGSRRDFLSTTAVGIVGTWLAGSASQSVAQTPLVPQAEGVSVLYPRDRVPLSFIIDDSTCLVNMGHFCTPQFGDAFPNRKEYLRPWKTWPREIPDSFVREFGEWCADRGVKGKYSVVPYPACVGWMDREIPGWSRRELQDSLKLVRELMMPNWDIHPEMITHTRVIDLKTGRPFPEIGPATIENSYPRVKKSADELAAYLAYALRILKNCELPCEGITTPGGFGNLVKAELSQAVQQSVQDVFPVEVPHYFKYVHTGNQSTEPILEHVSGAGTDDVKLTVNIPAGTGDWFGGWQGVTKSQGDLYSNSEATKGRMVEMIEKGQPALMLCHWPGMYCNGSKDGFQDFQKVVDALHRRFRDRVLWMKLSEIARYWAAKELTTITRKDKQITLKAPFATENYTLSFSADAESVPLLKLNQQQVALKAVSKREHLQPATWMRIGQQVIMCFDLPKGESHILL